MAIHLNSDLLVDMGFGNLTEVQGNQLLKEIYDALEVIVGARLSEEMTDDQYEAFTAFYEARDDAGASAWLDRNLPDHPEKARKQFTQLEGELRELARSVHELPALGGDTTDTST